jgi:hypothetical protein
MRPWRQSGALWDAGFSPVTSWPTRSRESWEPPSLGTSCGKGWGWMLKPAAFHGQLCFAPSMGANVRFARPDVWTRRAPRPESHRGWIDLTRRFLAA